MELRLTIIDGNANITKGFDNPGDVISYLTNQYPEKLGVSTEPVDTDDINSEIENEKKEVDEEEGLTLKKN